MAGEWGLADIKARIRELEALIGQVELEDGDGLTLVGEELRLDIESLSLAPGN
jgi:hypothetical protein